MTNSINGMKIAGIVLAAAMCCGATDAGAQVYLNFSGGNGSTWGGSGGVGSQDGDLSRLGISGAGFGSSQGPGGAGFGSGPGPGIPLFNPGAANAVGVAPKAGGTAPNSFSSALDGQSSPVNSATNTLTGSVGSVPPLGTIAAPNVPAKRKQNKNAGAAGRAAVVTPKTNPAGSP